jgi:hypothetical protein
MHPAWPRWQAPYQTWYLRTDGRIERFLNYHMRGRQSRRQAKEATLDRLLAMLRDHGWIAAARILPRKAQQLLDAYGCYLRDELGFVKTTVAGYIAGAWGVESAR